MQERIKSILIIPLILLFSLTMGLLISAFVILSPFLALLLLLGFIYKKITGKYLRGKFISLEVGKWDLR